MSACRSRPSCVVQPRTAREVGAPALHQRGSAPPLRIFLSACAPEGVEGALGSVALDIVVPRLPCRKTLATGSSRADSDRRSGRRGFAVWLPTRGERPAGSSALPPSPHWWRGCVIRRSADTRSYASGSESRSGLGARIVSPRMAMRSMARIAAQARQRPALAHGELPAAPLRQALSAPEGAMRL